MSRLPASVRAEHLAFYANAYEKELQSPTPNVVNHKTVDETGGPGYWRLYHAGGLIDAAMKVSKTTVEPYARLIKLAMRDRNDFCPRR